MSGETALRETKPVGYRRVLGWLPHLLALALAFGLVAAFVVNWNRWVGGAGAQWTDDAYLQSDLTPLSALVSGPVAQVAVGDFQRVVAGQLLVEIDDRTYRAQLAQAEANATAASAAITNLHAQENLQQANIAAAQAQLASAQAALERDRLEATRQESLFSSSVAGTRQAVERADAASKQSQAQVLQTAAGLEGARRQLEVQHSQEGQLEAALKAAEAARDLARINLGYTRIAAPTAGIVGQRRVFPGQYVGVGTQVASVVPLPNLYVIANYKETQLTNLKVGQPADVRIDTFPDVVLHGRVDSWSPATGSQFALLPPDNATGNFTKVVQRIPVKITFPELPDLPLRPGMSVRVTIDTAVTP